MRRAALALLALASCRADRHATDRHAARDELDLDVSVAASKPAPLVAFSCRTYVTGKRPNGEVRVTFSPASPRDATWDVAWTGTCHYHGALHLVNGRLDDGVLGLATESRCTRSPHSQFAVSCGPYLGSDVEVVAHGDAVTRAVHVRLPWTFRAGLDTLGACELPFVRYDQDGQPLGIDELDFALAECAVSG
ncbi:MAG: hypothetical protein ACM31C_01365 [Acidobacteriota bacterium]